MVVAMAPAARQVARAPGSIRMKIGIDATTAAQTRIVGISRFIINLITNLVEVDPTGEYYIFYRPRAFKRPHCIWRPSNGRFRIRMLQEPFNRRLIRSLDVFHATYQRLPAYVDLVPYLGTLHDIFYLSQPEMGSQRTRERWKARYRDVAARSRLIMTLSEFSKSEIVRLLDVEPSRVRVVPLAATAEHTPQAAATVHAVRQRYGLDRPYILCGGGFGRRKNAVGALRAFALALPRLPEFWPYGLRRAGFEASSYTTIVASLFTHVVHIDLKAGRLERKPIGAIADMFDPYPGPDDGQ
jgi:Glycosyltransferase Family 4